MQDLKDPSHKRREGKNEKEIVKKRIFTFDDSF